MPTGFRQLTAVQAENDGLKASFADGSFSLLRADHARYERLGWLLSQLRQMAEARAGCLLVWVAEDEPGVIADVNYVASGVPLSASRDESGAYSIVFPFSNVNCRLPADHPRFREFERYLHAALESDTLLYYVGSTEDMYLIRDMLPVAEA